MYFMITWTTYGHWVPGDSRGFRTHRGRQKVAPPARYANKGEEQYNPDRFEALYKEVISRSENSVMLQKKQMEVAAEVIAQVATKFSQGGVVAVMPNHVHVFVELSGYRTTGFFCNRVKSKSSLRLSDYGLRGRVWARRYHARRVDEWTVPDARRYVENHLRQGATVVSF